MKHLVDQIDPPAQYTKLAQTLAFRTDGTHRLWIQERAQSGIEPVLHLPQPPSDFYMPIDSFSKWETNNVVGPHKQAIYHSWCCDYVMAQHDSF